MGPLEATTEPNNDPLLTYPLGGEESPGDRHLRPTRAGQLVLNSVIEKLLN